MEEFILKTIIIFVAFAGFLLASYINKKKKKKVKLVCPMRSNCDTVINSDYSKIYGIKLEVLGMIYYAFIALGYGVVNNFPSLSDILSNILLPFSFFAFIFSLYLISVQAFVLKQWCFWCLSSALFSTIIFLISFFIKIGLHF